MHSKEIHIKCGEHLSDVYDTIETNTILCKSLTGIGATYVEIKTKRHSILIEPNVPPIKSKCQKPEHRDDNLFGVFQKISVDKICEYLENTISNNRYIKILSTPESFPRVKAAFEEVGINLYDSCFLLLDECHKFIQDVDYRGAVTLPIDDFFKFKNKAFVSATPIIPSDPRFEEQNFTLVNIVPNYIKGKSALEYDNVKNHERGYIYKEAHVITPDTVATPENHNRIVVSVVPTNNVLEAIKIWIAKVNESDSGDEPICFFINSTSLIHQLITKLGIENDSVVFCADKSVKKLADLGFNNAFEDWSDEHTKKYMFFTSRFYSSIDIEIDTQPNIIFVSMPFLSDYTLVDPFTDVKQAIGRFRNGISKVVHVAHFSKDVFSNRTQEDIEKYINGMRVAYETVKTLYEDVVDSSVKSALYDALKTLPYNSLLKDGELDYFALDNYKHDEFVKSLYYSPWNLVARYREAGGFTTWTEQYIYSEYGDSERISISQDGKSLKNKRMEIVKVLHEIKLNDALPEQNPQINDLRQIDSFIVDAFFVLGEDIIEECRYSVKKIKEKMLLTQTNGYEIVNLISNSFMVGQRYTLAFVKKELNRIYEIFGINSEKKVTAQWIRNYFEVKEVKLKGSKAFLIVAKKIGTSF